MTTVRAKKQPVAEPAPQPQITKREQEILSQLKIKKPLIITDKESSKLTINAGGGVEVEVSAKVPARADRDKYDGVLVNLTTMKSHGAHIVGDDLGQQKSVQPRTEAGAFEHHVSQGGGFVVGKEIYRRSERDRQTGEIVMIGEQFDPTTGELQAIKQRRIKKSGNEMVPPPAVGLIGLDPDYIPGPGIIAAQAPAGLKAGATLHVTGDSIEKLTAQVTTYVKPTAGGWSDPDGVEVECDTQLLVTNVDSETISHKDIDVRSDETGGRRYSNGGGMKTRHFTELKDVNLMIGPGDDQSIPVEKQKGRAHVEYTLGDSVSNREAGEGVENDVNSAERVMVLDSTKGKRHAGDYVFVDGGAPLGRSEPTGASPANAQTRSDERSGSVFVAGETTWSEPKADGEKRTQTMTKTYDISNISAVAGQMVLTVEVEGFTKSEIKINGKKITRNLEAGGVKASLSSRRYGGGELKIRLPVPAGSEQQPARVKLEVSVAGEWTVESDE